MGFAAGGKRPVLPARETRDQAPGGGFLL